MAFILFLLVPFVLGGLSLWFVRARRARGAGSSFRHLLLGNVLIFLFLLSLMFLGGESYYRFLYDTTDSIDYTLVSQRWFRRYYVANSAGFRDNIEYSLKIDPGKRRVTFIGDSFTVGHGIKSVEDRFANRIRAIHPEWEIHTLAKLGVDTGGELRSMKTFLADEGYQVDQVVLVYCMNDVADLFPEWDRALTNFFAKASQANWFVQNSYWMDTLHYRIAAAKEPYLKEYYSFLDDGYRGPLWERQKQRLTDFRDLILAHQGKFSVVIFPFVHAMGPGYKFQFAHEELNRFLDELKVPHLDLLNAYSNVPPNTLVVNRYDPHPNEYANEIAAREIERFLVQEMQPASVAPRH